MDSVDSSPNYMRARSRFDPKKENSPGGSECDETISVSSSTCGSAFNQPNHTRKLSNNVIKYRTSNNKSLKNFGTVRSFRRRAKPRVLQSPMPLSDDDYESLLESPEASPHYLKATTSSEGKKSRSQTSPRHSESTFDGSDRSTSHSSQPKLALSRTSSLRNVRILIKRASFKPKRSLLRYSKASEDAGVDRATYSSTLKDSKFPAPVEVPSREESEKSSVMRVCRYHHCSLHGGFHGSHESAPPPKRFLRRRKQSLRKQKSVGPKTETTRGVKKNLHKSLVVPEVESLNQERFSDSVVESEIGVDCHEGNYPNEETEQFGDGYQDVQEAYLVELAFGETSFPERSYRDSLDILRKYSSEEQDLGGVCSRCSCHNRDKEATATPKRAEADLSPREAAASSLEGKNNSKQIPQNESAVALDTCIDDVAVSFADGPNTAVAFDEIVENRTAFSSASSSNSEEDAGFATESSPAEDSKADEAAHVEDSETNTPAHNGGELQFSKPRHMSMWNLIHQHMSSNVSAESTDKDSVDTGAATNDSEAQEIEIRKLFAVKLVREAIEKILLPEIQDQSSDDQSFTSETTPRPELVEDDQSRARIQENDAESDDDRAKGNASSNPKEEAVVAGDAQVVRKSEKKAPKHWSNLKKWILLQRFIRELEKVRRFNPKKPLHLPLNPDPEAEKVSLRPQTVDERKSAEEWMLDHALRQAVSQLAPTQKKKVALLVRAFESVVPTQEEDSQVQSRIQRVRSSIIDDLKSSSENEKREDPGYEGNGEPISEARSLNLDGNAMADETKTEDVAAVQGLQDDAASDCADGKAKDSSLSTKMERRNHIKMWHMIYQHVVSDIAEKVGGKLLEGSEDGEEEEEEDSHVVSSNLRSCLTKSDALKLVKEAVDEILIPETQDEPSDTQSVSSDSVQDHDTLERNGNETGGENAPKEEDLKVPTSRNWSKLKKLLLLKRSIKALEKAREFKPKPHQVLPQMPDPEPEKVDLRQQMMNERKKAEQWMLDYAVQHIVTTLTPARKRRVSMLVEAFEAVVPLPEA